MAGLMRSKDPTSDGVSSQCFLPRNNPQLIPLDLGNLNDQQWLLETINISIDYAWVLI